MFPSCPPLLHSNSQSSQLGRLWPQGPEEEREPLRTARVPILGPLLTQATAAPPPQILFSQEGTQSLKIRAKPPAPPPPS